MASHTVKFTNNQNYSAMEQFYHLPLQCHHVDGELHTIIDMRLIKTKIRFQKSGKSDRWVGFVSQNTATGMWRGVPEDSRYPKMVCLVPSDLQPSVDPHVLYDVEMAFTERGGNGHFVLVSLEPREYEASIEVECNPTLHIYQACVSFGHKTIVYDPIGGGKQCMRKVSGVMDILNARKDIRNLPEVRRLFLEAAIGMLKSAIRGGYYMDPELREALELQEFYKDNGYDTEKKAKGGRKPKGAGKKAQAPEKAEKGVHQGAGTGFVPQYRAAGHNRRR